MINPTPNTASHNLELAPKGRASGRLATDQKVRDDIAALDSLDLLTLRTSWRRLYRAAAPMTFRRDLLIRGLAYQIQVVAYGGLTPKTRRTLLKFAAAAEQGTFTTAGTRRRLRSGTRLVRAYEGKTHMVEVLADGFAWDGRSYRSLSAVAKAISGTNWNGHVFFGLSRPLTEPRIALGEAVDV